MSSNILGAIKQGVDYFNELCQDSSPLSFKYCPKSSNNITTEMTIGNAELCIRDFAENITSVDLKEWIRGNNDTRRSYDRP